MDMEKVGFSSCFSYLTKNIVHNDQPNGKSQADDKPNFVAEAIENGLALWSEPGFIQNASLQHLKCKLYDGTEDVYT